MKLIITFKIFSHFGNLVHGVSTTQVGNIDYHFGEKRQVLKNRQKLASTLNFPLNNLYEMSQVHGSNIKILRYKDTKILRDKNLIPETDGLITDQKNVFLIIKTADCLPILIFDPKKEVIAAVHSGWRGTMEKIFLIAVLKMINEFGCNPSDLKIAIGPHIRKCCFLHKKLIQDKLPEWQPFIKEKKNGFKSLDLSGFVKRQLLETGIKKENIEISKICTNCNKNYFSHFRSLKTGEPEGRFAAVIGMK